MFTEILRIKPVLDRGSAGKMENDLSGRFLRVSKRFGSGLKSLMKGAILGISVGLIAKMLNPLKEVEERLKALGKKGLTTSDLAEKLGTDAGSVLELQAAGMNAGLTLEEVDEKLQKFADAVELARKELKDPGSEFSDSTRAVQQFAGETDMAAGFRAFMKGFNALPAGQGKDLAGKAVFGEKLTGSDRRFIESDIDQVRKTIGLPSRGELNSAAEASSKFEQKRGGDEAGVDLRKFVASSRLLNEQMLVAMLERAQIEKGKEITEEKRFQTLKKFEATVEEGVGLLRGMQREVENATIKAGTFYDWAKSHFGSPKGKRDKAP